MKILVLSDSHSSLRFMRSCIEKIKPRHVIHLGDHYDDASAIAEEFPNIIFHQVPGNCDRYRCFQWQVDTLCYCIEGAKFYMTHGHRFAVKSGTSLLLQAARENKVDAVLYGHTHIAECYQDENGMWVLNPGSCGSASGSAGIIEIENEKITACYIIKQAELDEM